MKIKSEWRNYTYYFDLFVEKVSELDDALQSKEALVKTKIYNSTKELLWCGLIPVKWNSIGIYPDPKQLNQIDLPQTIKRMLLVELKRYLKRQKDFL